MWDIDSFDPWIRPSDAFRSLGRALSYFGLGLGLATCPSCGSDEYVPLLPLLERRILNLTDRN